MVAGVVAVAALVLGLMFSFVFLVFAAAIGLMVFGWLWWKTRQLRKLMRAAQAQATGAARQSGPGGSVIEGEVLSAQWQDKPGSD